MLINLEKLRQRLKTFRLPPFSLAAKCRIAFGFAILVILALALLLPYIWMGQLTKQASLDAGRAKTDLLFNLHFQLKEPAKTAFIALNGNGEVLDVNSPEIQWVYFKKDFENQLKQLTHEQKEMLKTLKGHRQKDNDLTLIRKNGALYSSYARIFKATESCISCHNPQGSAEAFNRNEPIGIAFIEKPAAEFSKTTLINCLWVIVAGIIAGTGAIVAFYIITQKVILSPIRQLRAIANNVAEGNLDIRSSIKTGDEFERLAVAFNNMLDSLNAAQEKLRQANRLLDAKIVELSERNIDLFKANQIKGEFLANVSHEFRTPLNAILGFAEILRDKPDSIIGEKRKRYAQNIIDSGKNLLNMINDLLDLAKTEAGKMKLHVEKTSVRQLCEEITGAFDDMAQRKNISLNLTVDENIPELTTDAGKVKQILSNFLSNAVKFTPENGRIDVKAAMLDEKTLRLAVTDTGCGIAEADKEKIFEKFQQADGSITRRSDGTGLGLAICRQLAAMLAGAISLESEIGKGSAFWLDIPISLTKYEA